MSYFKLTLFFSLVIHHANAQKIIGPTAGYYQYDGLNYKFSDMDVIFSDDKHAHDIYLGSEKSLKAGRVLGTTSLVAMGLGTIGILSGNNQRNCEFICLSDVQIFGLISWLVVVPITGSAGIISHIVGINLQKKSIHLYNERESIGINTLPSNYLSIGIASHGAGLTYIF